MLIPELVATDLDGTIVRTDGTISERTVAAFARVVASGAALVIVTGRPPRWMAEIRTAIGHRGLAICANGALVYDLQNSRVVASNLINPEVLADVVSRLRSAIPGLTFSVEYEGGSAHENGWNFAGRDRGANRTFVAPSDLVARPATKLLAYHPEFDADRLLAMVAGVAGTGVTPTHSSSRGLIEMSAAGVTKASTLARLAAAKGVRRDRAIAFGDMPNDLPMLVWAGTSWAVANAHPEVLAAADHVTSRVDEDGVAQVLDRIYK